MLEDDEAGRLVAIVEPAGQVGLDLVLGLAGADLPVVRILVP
jgi:NAD/NADP transhydrogenase beta subunit